MEKLEEEKGKKYWEDVILKKEKKEKTNYYPFCRGIHAWTVYTLLALLLALMAHR